LHLGLKCGILWRLFLVLSKRKNNRRLLQMRKLVWLCGLFLALAVPAMAQDELPKFDVFGGYSYVHFSTNPKRGGGNITSNLNGGSGSASFYPSEHFGVVADFGGYKLGNLHQGSRNLGVSGTVFTYLFGPRVRFSSGGVTPFAQVLFGGAHNGNVTTGNAAFCAPGAPPCTVFKSDNAFALTAGGGADFKIARHFALRGQAEYLMTRFKQPGSTSTGTQNNARISVGIVIH
jgi:opacity protein-like surface antigen